MSFLSYRKLVTIYNHLTVLLSSNRQTSEFSNYVTLAVQIGPLAVTIENNELHKHQSWKSCSILILVMN